MKALYILPLLLATLFVLPSCEDDQDLLEFQVPTLVKQNFQSMYPEAAFAEWERQGTTYKAEFHWEGSEAEAWFDKGGNWIRTEFDYRGTLPQPVQDLLLSKYANYEIDDVEWVETPSGNYYQFELERNGRLDKTLKVREDGTVL